MSDLVSEAYERWEAGDIEGFLAVFPDDATFVIPGGTRISGDHDKASMRGVLETVAEATREGGHRQERVCSYIGSTGMTLVFDNFVNVEGTDVSYHSVHEWILRDGIPQVWLLYLHEYDRFERAWK